VSTLERIPAHHLPLAFVELPPFPAIALKALQVMARRDSRLRELHDLIRTDQAFSAEILRLVNSPLYAFPSPIHSTMQATMLLGFERVQALTVTIAIRAYLRDALEMPVLRACWRHSLACACVAEHLSRIVLADKDVLYTAGIMHDIGRLALAVCHRAPYTELLSARRSPAALLDRERELFGIDHCAAGKSLAEAWNLPSDFATVAARHHEPFTGKCDVLFLLQLACALADSLGFAVIPPAGSPAYSELRLHLPDRDRHYLPEDPAELVALIKAKIHLLERQ